MSPTKAVVPDLKVLELHGILFFFDLNPNFARMNNFHMNFILLTALFGDFLYCRWSLSLFNCGCIKSTISTTRGSESVWDNLNNLRGMSPCNHSIPGLPFELQRIIKDSKIRLHIKVSFLAMNLTYLMLRKLCVCDCCPILSI